MAHEGIVRDNLLLEVEKNKDVMRPAFKSHLSISNVVKEKNKKKIREATTEKLEVNVVRLRDEGELLEISKRLNEYKEGASCISAEVIGAFHALAEAVSEYKEGDEKSLGLCCDLMVRTTEALRGYNESHSGIIWFSRQGKKRKMLFKEASKYLQSFSEDMSLNFLPLEKEKYDAEYTEEEKKRAERHIQKLTKSVLLHWSQIGKNTLDTPEERIRKKLIIYDTFRQDFTVYRTVHREKMSKDMQAFYAEYDELVKQKNTLQWVKKNLNGEIEKDGVTKEIRAEAHKSMARTEINREKLDNKEIDKGLSKKQLEAIDRIDRWFLRNFNNGGLAGKFLTFLKVACVDVINELMSRSKRERLHIYYLIETDARKNPSLADVGASQTEELYIPDLKKLKGKMLASKLKVKAHFTGAYVYWHKLSEAMNISDKHTNLLASMSKMQEISEKDEVKALAEKEQAEEKQNEESLAQKRQDALLHLHSSLIEYAKTLKKSQKAGKKEKKELDSLAKSQALDVETYLKEMITYDNAIGESLKENDVLNRYMQNPKDHMLQAGFDATAIGGISTGVGAISWGLDGSALGNLKIYSTDIGTSFSSISGLLALCSNCYVMASTWKDTTAAESAMIGLDMLKTASGMMRSIWTTVEKTIFLNEHVENVTQEVFQASSNLATASYVAGGVTMAIGAVKGGVEFYRSRKTKSVAELLKQKREEKQQEAQTEEEKEKLKREEQYENALIRMSQLTHHRKYVSAAGIVAAGALSVAATAITVPVAGTVVSVIAIGVGVVAGIVDAVMLAKSQEGFFDTFMNMDHIISTVTEKMKEENRPIGKEKEFRKMVRRKVAAALGFPTVNAACDQLAKDVANYLMGKLFDENLSEEEKKPYILALKGLGIKYKPSADVNKRRPQLQALAKAISGR